MHHAAARQFQIPPDQKVKEEDDVEIDMIFPLFNIPFLYTNIRGPLRHQNYETILTSQRRQF